MSTAVLDQNTFPNCTNGDVKVVLSENSDDTLMLNASVEAGRDVEKVYKLLELDFDESNTLPLLVGALYETPSSRIKTKKDQHDEVQSASVYDNYLTGTMYKGCTIITAYRIGFALIYGLRIKLPADEVHKAAFFISALVDFLDAHGLLPTYNDKVLGVIFGGSCDGYDLIAGDPFRFLRVACKLQSEVIFREAMMHAVAIHNRLSEACTMACDPKWFSAIGEQRLYKQCKAQAKTFHSKIARIDRHLLHIEPMCCGKITVARDIGMAIFREWITQNTSDGDDGYRSHVEIIRILKKDWDIPDMITRYRPYNNGQIVNVNVGHIHRTIENSFEQAHEYVSGVFCEGKEPTASPRRKIGCLQLEKHDEKHLYYANLYFPKDYQYPWEQESKVKLPEFAPFDSTAANEVENFGVQFG